VLRIPRDKVGRAASPPRHPRPRHRPRGKITYTPVLATALEIIDRDDARQLIIETAKTARQAPNPLGPATPSASSPALTDGAHASARPA
jgi:hypothetical protein